MSKTEIRFARLQRAVRTAATPLERKEAQLRLETAARIASRRHYAKRMAAFRSNAI